MKLKYIGKVTPCRIKAGSAIFNDLRKGEVLDISDSIAEKLLKNKYFVKESSSEKKKDIKKEKKENAVVDYDLNNDGVFDKKDKRIAGKVLSGDYEEEIIEGDSERS